MNTNQPHEDTHNAGRTGWVNVQFQKHLTKLFLASSYQHLQFSSIFLSLNHHGMKSIKQFSNFVTKPISGPFFEGASSFAVPLVSTYSIFTYRMLHSHFSLKVIISMSGPPDHSFSRCSFVSLLRKRRSSAWDLRGRRHQRASQGLFGSRSEEINQHHVATTLNQPISIIVSSFPFSPPQTLTMTEMRLLSSAL